jgi:hypothetical protein
VGGQSCLALDVNALRRKGALAPGAFGTLTWEREGDVQTSVDFRADSAGIVLSYDDHNGEAPRAVERHVALSSVTAAFGGSRTYFLCPGAECGRRVSILYFRRGVFGFGCRHCHGLAYESQREDKRQRARRRADKLRSRLGWPQQRGIVLPVAVKPKGMWRPTYKRVHRDAVAAESAATAFQVAHWTRLLARVNRRQR